MLNICPRSLNYVVHLWFLHFEVKLWPLINFGSWNISYPCHHHVNFSARHVVGKELITLLQVSRVSSIYIQLSTRLRPYILSFDCGFGSNTISTTDMLRSRHKLLRNSGALFQLHHSSFGIFWLTAQSTKGPTPAWWALPVELAVVGFRSWRFWTNNFL